MLDLAPRQRLYLWLAAIFLTALIVGDTIGSKLFTFAVPLGFTTVHATLSVGAIWFPITFLLTDVINEFYGSKGARLVTWVGFCMAVFAFFAIYCARKIPAAGFSPVQQDAFDNVLGNANRIFVASLIAYLVGQLVDITVFQAAKKLTQSRHIWLRSTGSTLISQLIDTLVVTYVAFTGKLTAEQLRQTAVTSYFLKVLAAIGLTPVIYALHALLHRRLHLEEMPATADRVHEPMP
jgi:queuosine precursor transporter